MRSYLKKQIEVSFPCVCPVIDTKFHHSIVKVVCGSTVNCSTSFRTRASALYNSDLLKDTVKEKLEQKFYYLGQFTAKNTLQTNRFFPIVL